MKIFRWVAYMEGISFLVLLFVAMPLKYMMGQPLAVKIVGMAHGVLFVLYVCVLAIMRAEHNWSARKTLLGFAAGVLPFGTFIFERKYAEAK